MLSATNRIAAIFVIACLAFTASAGAAAAASYRADDVEAALIDVFQQGHGGTNASAACSAATSNSRWRCRIGRGSGDRSSWFRVIVKRRGTWTAQRFRFPGFTGDYDLSGCCLKRH